MLQKVVLMGLVLLSRSISAAQEQSEYAGDLQLEDVAFLNTYGESRLLTKEQFDGYSASVSVSYRPESEGYFGVERSKDGRLFSTYFQKSSAQKPAGLVVMFAGFTGNPQDMGAYASKVLPTHDGLIIGAPWDQVPYAQDKPGGNIDGGCLGRMLGGSIFARQIGYFASYATVCAGGIGQRIKNEPVDDILTLLHNEQPLYVEKKDADGSIDIIEVQPKSYKYWAAIGQCYGGALALKMHKELVQKTGRGFGAVVVDSPQDEFFNSVEDIKPLQQAGTPVNILVIKGGQDKSCTEASVIKLLGASSYASKAVFFKPYNHISTIYNGRSSERKIRGGRDVLGGIIQEFLTETNPLS